MTAVFRLLGIDYRQWKAMTRTLLRTDFRLPLGHRASTYGRVRDLAALGLFLSLFGLGAAMMVMLTPDVLLSGTLALTYLSIMLATVLLTQHGATLLSTADYTVLGSRPVSSPTFLAIRLTNVLFHALLATTLMSYPVVLAYALSAGASVWRTLAATGAIYAWAITLTLGVVASYSALLRTVGAARFKRAVGYLQVAAGVMTYGGLLVVSRSLGAAALARAAMPDVWWLVLTPPAWFASYLELAAGASNSTTVLRAGLSVAILITLSWALGRKLGLTYARELAELPHAAAAPVSALTATPFFERAEGRAVALLVLAHFRHDMRVRMGVLAIVPLMILYVALGSGDEQLDLVALSVLLFPALVSQHFASTDAYRAAWVYRTTPANHGQLILALKNVTVVYFLLPFLLLVAAVLVWRHGALGEGLVRTASLGLLAHLALQGSIILRPSLPFASPPDRYRGSGTLIGWMLVVILGGQGALWLLDTWVYVMPARTMSVLALLVVVSWALNRLIARRVTGCA